jgi:hypothetical protein
LARIQKRIDADTAEASLRRAPLSLPFRMIGVHPRLFPIRVNPRALLLFVFVFLYLSFCTCVFVLACL